MLFTDHNLGYELLIKWIEELDESILVLNRSGEITFCNNKTTQTTGLSNDALTRLHFDSLFNQTDNLFWSTYVQLAKEKRACPIHGRLKISAGKQISVEGTIKHYDVLQEDFFILSLKETIWDTTYFSDSFVSKSEFLNKIIGSSKDAILFFHTHTNNIVDCNQRAVDLFELDSKHDLIGKKDLDLRAVPLTEEEIGQAALMISAEIEWNDEVLYKTKSNRHFWGRLNITKVVIDLEELYMIRITDIDHEKKATQKIIQSEKKYRDLVKYNQALICTHDLNGIILSVNPASMQALQIEHEDEVIGKKLELLFDKNRIHEYHKYLRKVNEEGKASGIMEVKNKNGEKIYWIYNNYTVQEEGEEPYVVGSARDITDRLLIEKELIQAKAQAISSLKARELFLANISHEIRTPMNGIMGILELLNKTITNPVQTKYVDIIQKSSERLLVIINDILDYTKIESGTIVIEEVPFDIVETSKSIIQSLLLKANDKKIDLIFDFNHHSPIHVSGDPYRYGQVIINLVNNAIKFTEKGTVSLLGEITDETDAYYDLKITVRDTGIGIQKKDHHKIFEEFTQAHFSHTRKYGGTGLGLSICKRLIEMQGGTLEVESESGKGSSFIIHYRLNKVVNTEEQIPEELTVDVESLKGLTVLLAEDNEVNQYLVKTILELYGIQVDVVDDGKKVIYNVHKKNYDIILMDIQMPDIDGMEATVEIRRNYSRTVPIIALTANAMKGDLEKYLSAGMNDYLSKPFKEKELLNKIGKLLNLPFTMSNRFTNQNERMPQPQTELYSTSYLSELGAKKPEFIKAMLTAFVSSVPKDVAKLKEAFDAGDIRTVNLFAHKLKSAVKTLLIQHIEENLYYLEKYNEAKPNEKFVESYTSVIEVLEKVVEKVSSDIQ